jgi:hypothetical protein
MDTIQRGLMNCKGMQRFYLIRYQKTKNGKLIPVKEKDWIPFYRDPRYPEIESFPEGIWNNLVTLKSEVQKSLCRGGQWDGRTTSAKVVGAQPSFFRYLKDQFEDVFGDEISKKSFRFTRARKVFYDSLAVTRRRLKIDGELIRIMFEDELDAVRKILGVSFGVGVLQPVPSLKMLRENHSLKATVWLRNTDPVRIVSCSPDGCDIEGLFVC